MVEQRWGSTSKYGLCTFKAMCTYCFISTVRHLKKSMRLINLRYISLQKTCLCLISLDCHGWNEVFFWSAGFARFTLCEKCLQDVWVDPQEAGYYIPVITNPALVLIH